MHVSFYDVPCVFSKEIFNQGAGVAHVITRPRGCVLTVRPEFARNEHQLEQYLCK
jgi:heat shock protein HspQ